MLKGADTIETFFIPLSLKSTRADLTSSLHKSKKKRQCDKQTPFPTAVTPVILVLPAQRPGSL